jgi:hypothetical protein
MPRIPAHGQIRGRSVGTMDVGIGAVSPWVELGSCRLRRNGVLVQG